MLGAGYVGAKLAELALEEGRPVTLADNWAATRKEQVRGLELRGARVVTADIRKADDVKRLVGEAPSRVYLLAAQASRPIAWTHPDYTEQTNVTGARRVAEEVALAGGGAIPLVYGSSLHVYGPSPRGEVDATHPYGEQGDLAHLSKLYAEQCLAMHARRRSFDLALLRLGIVYGPGPVEHDHPDSQTVVDRFRRLHAAGEELTLDDGGRATIGVVHVADVARILLDMPWGSGIHAANVVAETVTVADVAALVRGDEPPGGASCTYVSPFAYGHRLAEYLAP